MHRGGVGLVILYIFCYNIGIPTMMLVYKEKQMETVTKRKVLQGLRNGADALMIFRGQNVGVVLATWREEYVTWVFYNDDLATTGHGNYHMWNHTSESEAFENAKADFLKRVERYTDDTRL